MKCKLIHSTDIAVSQLGLGTVKFGRNQQVKYPSQFDLPSDDEIMTLLDMAQELGINFIDTAPAYGISEERLGKLLGSRRDDWVIMSKAGEDFHDSQSHFDFSPCAINESVERTLLRLRTNRVECLLLHSSGEDLEILDHSGAVETLFNLKEQGLVRSIGISTKTVEGGLRAIELVDAAEKSGTSVFLKKTFGSGWLGDENASADPVAEALGFVFSHPATTSAVVGTINPKHLRENCETLERVQPN